MTHLEDKRSDFDRLVDQVEIQKALVKALYDHMHPDKIAHILHDASPTDFPNRAKTLDWIDRIVHPRTFTCIPRHLIKGEPGDYFKIK